jgi:hypothetical protein
MAFSAVAARLARASREKSANRRTVLGGRTMAQLFKSFIPAEFLDSWTRGQYVIGPRTLDYQYAGLALIFRGFYRYDVWRMRNEDREDLFGGYVAVDIQDNELNFAGFRLYSRDNAADERTPLF